MRYISHLGKLIVISIVFFYVTACSKPNPNTITVGTIAGPETELVEAARDVANKDYGINIKIVEFTDYNLPNEALQDGSLDVNVYQHLPYLQAAIKTHGYQLQAIGKTFIYPTGIYSKKVRTLHSLPRSAIIAIPNDPSNEARALRLLQNAGLITLKNSLTATTNDVAANPKHLQFKEMDAAQLPRVLEDVDAAVINTNYALSSGLNPLKDALFIENKHSPYANIIVVKQGNENSAQLMNFVKAMHSKEVVAKAKNIFGQAAIPAW